MGWLRVKLALVLLLIAYHGYCYKLMRDFAQNRNARSARWYRALQRSALAVLIAIVLLAVVKPGLARRNVETDWDAVDLGPPLRVGRQPFGKHQLAQIVQRPHVNPPLEIHDFAHRCPIVGPAPAVELRRGGGVESQLRFVRR